MLLQDSIYHIMYLGDFSNDKNDSMTGLRGREGQTDRKRHYHFNGV